MFKDVNQMDCYLTCSSKVGRGDHEIESLVTLYAMNSEQIDFANVQFKRGSQFFLKPGSGCRWLYVDEEKSHYKQKFVLQTDLTTSPDNPSRDPHIIDGKLSIQRSTLFQDGYALFDGILSDRYGRSHQKFKTVIAKWGSVAHCSYDESTEMKPLGSIEKYKVLIYASVAKNPENNNYDLIRISFAYHDGRNQFPLIRWYKKDAAEDWIYLYQGHTKETPMQEVDYIFKTTEEINKPYIEFSVRSAEMFPPTEDYMGKLNLDAYISDGNTTRHITGTLFNWDTQGDPVAVHAAGEGMISR
ncbi:hypothetical protein AMS62_26325 [Bacillus sp. FJAT-18019]|nr:hypothetical protein AMS62_26325 [Bacillus sp. FJAT-18019]